MRIRRLVVDDHRIPVRGKGMVLVRVGRWVWRSTRRRSQPDIWGPKRALITEELAR